MFHRRTPLEKEWDILTAEEERLLLSLEKRETGTIDRMLAGKVPEKLRSTLDAAFRSAFSAVFEKGGAVIEKTMSRTELEKQYKIRAYADSLQQNRKSLRAFSGQAKKTGRSNLLIGGGAGIGMGLLGIGLPDIPVLTGLFLRSMYEIALSYGYSYDTEEERALLLLLTEGALASGAVVRAQNDAVNRYLASMCLPQDYDRAKLIASAASALSGELLYMKFLQGIPVIGVVGGAYDAVYLRRITRYAELKYRRRFLSDRKKAAGK